jgi:hypothetical protein
MTPEGNIKTKWTWKKNVKPNAWLVVSNMFYFPFHICGMSSFPLTNVFRRGGSSTNQIVEPWVVQALAAPELWHRSIAASDADERGGFGSAPRATRGGSCRVYRG